MVFHIFLNVNPSMVKVRLKYPDFLPPPIKKNNPILPFPCKCKNWFSSSRHVFIDAMSIKADSTEHILTSFV